MRRLLPRSTGARAILAIVAFFVALNVVALVVSGVRPEPSGEDGSAYATQPRGAAAYAELLRRNGHPVRYERTPLGEAALDPGETVVLLDAPALGHREQRALDAFVRSGGRLVAGGEDAGTGIIPGAPTWVPRGPRVATRAATVPETRFVRRVVSAGSGGFSPGGAAQPALGADPVLLAVAAAGRGRALLLADASPLQNRLLARADNAQLGLALAGDARRPVTFVESVHGFGRRSGLAALPANWRAALVGAVLAAGLWLLSRARRFGPAEDPGSDPAPPPRREHVEALAIALSHVRDPEAALAPVRAAARAQVARRAALGPDASDGALRDAALRLGFEEDEAAALTGEQAGDEALALGRALARGRR
jgi:hypothetical protein